MEYLSLLNEQQREAVTAPPGPIAVLAGAGSGKTRVLTYRILHLIRAGTPPEEILAVTFTNKAAREMLERVRVLIAEEKVEREPIVTTFHSLGVRLLREFHREAGLPKYFSIYDRADSIKIIKTIFSEMDIDEKQIEPRAVLSKISKEKGEGRGPEALLSARSSGLFLKTVAHVWERYERALTEAGALDFDDLLIRPLTLLRTHEKVRDTLERRFSHLLIDEYQDTNNTQSSLAHLLARRHRSIFVVGDIDQNIYSWRGATIEHLLSFEEVYPGARIILLEQNYRSTKTIVDSAQAVIEKNVRRKEKGAFTENKAGEPIRLFVCSTETEEARLVATLCRERMEEGEDPGTIAVLYRTNFQSRVLEEAMLHAEVPYQVLGTKFFDRKEVKDVLAYARLIVLGEGNTVDLSRVLNVPARGIGKVTQLAVLEKRVDSLAPSARRKVEGFFALIETMRRATATLPPSKALRYILSASGIEEEYEKGGDEAHERLENIRELVTLAGKHDTTIGHEGLMLLLEEVALVGEQDTMKDASAGVKLMTVHAAKGLEFRTVFVTGLEEGLFPHDRSTPDDDEEEERRLFYVALTRAHENVFLSCARTRRIYGTTHEAYPSSFIADIPQNHLRIEDGDASSEYVIT